ncbi:hypothetical protein [Glycomyces sp. MUSA5-2]|uniref:hypothetical protein n=1 Tax=Glycomyces sp. MUSA5-2 TaxID=2053002 RepID=UPI0030080E89
MDEPDVRLADAGVLGHAVAVGFLVPDVPGEGPWEAVLVLDQYHLPLQFEPFGLGRERVLTAQPVQPHTEQAPLLRRRIAQGVLVAQPFTWAGRSATAIGLAHPDGRRLNLRPVVESPHVRQRPVLLEAHPVSTSACPCSSRGPVETEWGLF